MQKLKYIVDMFMFLVFLIVALSGFILWLILPKGSGNSLFLILTRNEWIFVHNWSSVIFILLLLIHLILNWNWIILVTKSLFENG